MKALLLTTHLNIGGVSSYTVNLAKGLKKKNLAVWVASSGGEMEKELKKEGIPHLKADLNTKFEFHPKLLFAFFRLLNFIKKENIEIIHAQTRVAQVLGWALSAFTGIAYVSTCHGFFKSERLGRRIFDAWGKYAIAISDAVREHLIKDFRLKKDRVILIYNGVDSEKFSRRVAEDEKGAIRRNLGFAKFPIVGSVTRLSPVKGLRYLFFAMKDILREMPEVKLLLVGEGPSKAQLTELANKLGIQKSVFFGLSTTQIQRFLSIIDVFVFYSLEEGLGISLLEALAAGKPCVASDVGGVSSVIEDGKTGILVPPKDTHALKEAIIKVFKEDRLRASLSKKGQDLVKEKFSLERMVKGVMDVYEKASEASKK